MERENKFDKRFAELFFEGKLDHNEAIEQVDENHVTRKLVPLHLKYWDTTSRFYYVLYEKKPSVADTVFIYIIAQRPITGDENLFTIQFTSKGYFFKDDDKMNKQVMARYVNGFSDACMPLKYVLLENPPETVCIDWYEVWYNVETGQIVEEIFLYTQCYPIEDWSGGSGGGGGCIPPNPPQIISLNTSFTEEEEDPGPDDGSGGAPRIAYYYNSTLHKNADTGQLLEVYLHNTTASPMIANYIDN